MGGNGSAFGVEDGIDVVMGPSAGAGTVGRAVEATGAADDEEASAAGAATGEEGIEALLSRIPSAPEAETPTGALS
jgi:hypothetical protein